jgi:putative phosphoribosyl transferase
MKTREIKIPAGTISLTGDLTIPTDANSIVIFSHGSGSGRLSPRNNHVATILNKENIGTLLIDLLTESEADIFENRFNIELLTERLVSITQFIHDLPELKNLTIGYFGASTGAASALKATAEQGKIIKAIVSRGGRPDLAKPILNKINVPTLLIVGGLDTEVIKLNERAYSLLNCDKKIEIVKGASHLFEEPGKLDEAASLATTWFKKYINNPEIKEHAI